MKKISIILISILTLCSCMTEPTYSIKENLYSFDSTDSAHIDINKLMQKRFLELKSELIATDSEYRESEKKEGIKYPNKLELIAKTEVFINTPKFFSARNDYCIYTGGAHGDCASEGFNIVFDGIGNFKNLKLFDVFPENKKDELSKLVIEKLKKTYPDGLLLGDIKKPDDLINAIDGFVIKQGGIEIFFNKYGVACGACGTTPIFLDFKEIASLGISSPINCL